MTELEKLNQALRRKVSELTNKVTLLEAQNKLLLTVIDKISIERQTKCDQ